MKDAVKSMAWAAGALLAAVSAQDAAAAATACRYRIGAAEQAVALNAISNVMGRYSHLGGLYGEDTLEQLFAMKQPDVSWRSPTGPQGPEALRARFRQPGEAPRADVPGQLHVHAMLTPVIEVAADGRTAKGVWDSFGPNINSGSDIGNWLWVKYAVDFIKEDGAWKIWHMQVYALFNTPVRQVDHAERLGAGQPGHGGDRVRARRRAGGPAPAAAPTPAAAPGPTDSGSTTARRRRAARPFRSRTAPSIRRPPTASF